MSILSSSVYIKSIFLSSFNILTTSFNACGSNVSSLSINPINSPLAKDKAEFVALEICPFSSLKITFILLSLFL